MDLTDLLNGLCASLFVFKGLVSNMIIVVHDTLMKHRYTLMW